MVGKISYSWGSTTYNQKIFLASPERNNSLIEGAPSFCCPSMSCNSIQFFALATSDVIKLVFGNDDKNNLEKTILIVTP